MRAALLRAAAAPARSGCTSRVTPASAREMLRLLEPLRPMFVEEPINCQNHDLMAEIAGRRAFWPMIPRYGDDLEQDRKSTRLNSSHT